MSGFSIVCTDGNLLRRWHSQTSTTIDEAVKHGLRCFRKDDSGKLIGCSYEELLRLRSAQDQLLSQARTFSYAKTGRDRERVKKLRFYFYESDIESFEAKHRIKLDIDARKGEESAGESIENLSCNAMLEQPVFNIAIEVMGVLVDFCLKTKLPSRKEAWKFITECGKYPDLTEDLFIKIWHEIPPHLRRKKGHTDDYVKSLRKRK